MLMPQSFDVAVVGGGPAGLAAAIAASKEGAGVLLVERESRLGGILKQCIHDGFGLVRFGERLTGPEYAYRFTEALKKEKVAVKLSTFLTSIASQDKRFTLSLVGAGGVSQASCRSLVLATGCRERTARQVSIHGTRPAGILTAGAAQHYVNILGQLPTKRCVVLGSGDIGLIMARRLTLEGAKVLGVYEAKPTPSGLSRNIAQCLEDFGIPLFLSHTVTRAFGSSRLEAVEVAQVDESMAPIPGTSSLVQCDGLVLSVGLIPENELAEALGIPLDPKTKGPVCDQFGMTLVEGVHVCGNAMQVCDLVDYVSESGESAGQAAARRIDSIGDRKLAEVKSSKGFLHVAPQLLDLSKPGKAVMYFRSGSLRGRTIVKVSDSNGKELFSKVYLALKPPEMERIFVDLPPKDTKTVFFSMEDA
jgi:NADPH-dependent 2,4-dienoyl-CoA reductase/sulfur reductase-like enzyme